MKKLMIGSLCVLLGTLAYFAATAPSVNDEINKGPMISPYVTYRVRIPIPNGGGIREMENTNQIVKANDKPWLINGKPVVMTKRDQTVMSQAMMRKVYGFHDL